MTSKAARVDAHLVKGFEPASRGTGHEIREIANRLSDLADMIDLGSEAGTATSLRDRQDGANRDRALAETARQLYRIRRRRAKFLDVKMLGEPVWDMLLELYVRHAQGERVSTTNLCVAGDAPITTALRWIGVLERAGLVVRSPALEDHRVTFVELSDAGLDAMRNCLTEQSAR